MPVTVTTADAAEDLDRSAGRVMRLLIDGAAGDERVSVVTSTVPPGSAGPPLHVHPGTDELFLVDEGVLLLHVDGTTHRLGPGSAAFVPRGVAHSFASTPSEAARFWAVHTPGGFEQMHREVAIAERAAGRPFGPREIMPIAAKYDWQLAGPPLLPTGELAAPAGPGTPS